MRNHTTAIPDLGWLNLAGRAGDRHRTTCPNQLRPRGRIVHYVDNVVNSFDLELEAALEREET
jgi:hypothetical protein